MTQKLITCQIADQYLGIDIMAIREIRVWAPATPLPGTPAHVMGVINLRGTVVPVIDLRHRLGWGITAVDSRNVMIVVDIAGQWQGLIVDAVDDVATFEQADVQPVPDMGNGTAGSLLTGLCNAGDRMILLLNLDAIVQPIDLEAAAQAA